MIVDLVKTVHYEIYPNVQGCFLVTIQGLVNSRDLWIIQIKGQLVLLGWFMSINLAYKISPDPYDTCTYPFQC